MSLETESEKKHFEAMSAFAEREGYKAAHAKIELEYTKGWMSVQAEKEKVQLEVEKQKLLNEQTLSRILAKIESGELQMQFKA